MNSIFPGHQFNTAGLLQTWVIFFARGHARLFWVHLISRVIAWFLLMPLHRWVNRWSSLGNTDHTDLSFNIHASFLIKDEPVSRKIFLKSRGKWASVIADLKNFGGIFFGLIAQSSPLKGVTFNKRNKNVLSSYLKRRKDRAWFNYDRRRAQRKKQVAHCKWFRLRLHEF